MSMGWTELERVLRAQLLSSIENDPRVLLERDGGPEGLKADIILANLYGYDDQIEAEWRINRASAVLHRPIRQRLTLLASDPSPGIPYAEYVLQSSYATMKLNYGVYSDSLPNDVLPDRMHQLTVALVRYKRRRESR